jgi:hypothetical protein
VKGIERKLEKIKKKTISAVKGIERKPDERKAQLVTKSNGNQMKEKPQLGKE